MSSELNVENVTKYILVFWVCRMLAGNTFSCRGEIANYKKLEVCTVFFLNEEENQ